MPKVSISIGMNIPLSKENRFDRLVPSISILDIDTELPIGPQIEKAVDAVKPIWDAISEVLEQSITKELGENWQG